MEKSYIKNLETGKIELHFSKTEYKALSEETKKELKRYYLFSGQKGAWVSRSIHNHYMAISIAKKLGFTDGGETGERLSYKEQLEVKAEKAEARIERYEQYADNAANRGKTLQAERDKYRGDIAFWTQPIMRGHAGSESFAKYRNRVIERYHKGFEEYRKSDYFKEKAIIAQSTAEMKQLTDKRYLDNRIKESNARIRELERIVIRTEQSIYDGKENDEYLTKILEKMEWELDKLAFLENCLDEIGGIKYSQDNIKPGYHVKIRGVWKLVLKANKTTVYVRILEGGAKGFELKYPYAEIQEMRIPDDWKEEVKETENPFEIGDIVYYTNIGGNRILRAYQVVKKTNKTVTIQRIEVKENKPIKDSFISQKQERRTVKRDRQNNIVVNHESWYLYKYAS